VGGWVGGREGEGERARARAREREMHQDLDGRTDPKEGANRATPSPTETRRLKCNRATTQKRARQQRYPVFAAVNGGDARALLGVRLRLPLHHHGLLERQG
jgi:hypothetical protein